MATSSRSRKAQLQVAFDRYTDWRLPFYALPSSVLLGLLLLGVLSLLSRFTELAWSTVFTLAIGITVLSWAMICSGILLSIWLVRKTR
jgi:hypothetical protein